MTARQVAGLGGAGCAGLVRRGRSLECPTVGRKLVEGPAAVGAGVVAGSAAAAGFGSDSLIESLSGGGVPWRLRSDEGAGRRGRVALGLAGVSFVALAANDAFDAVKAPARREPPDAARGGIAWRRSRPS